MSLAFMKPLKAEYQSQTFMPGMGENQYGTPFTIDEAESVTSRNLSSRAFPAMQTRSGRAAAFAAVTTPNALGARDNQYPHVQDGTTWKQWSGSVWSTIKSGLTSARGKFIDFNTGTTQYTILTNGTERYAFSNTATSAWVEKANTLSGEYDILSLCVFNAKLYGGTSPSGKLYEWNGTNAWTEVAPQSGTEDSIHSLFVFNNKLYGSTGSNGKLLEWNGTNAWIEKAPKLGSETIVYSLTSLNGKLYGSTYPNGQLLEWNGTNAWILKAPKLGSVTTVYSLMIYNGKIYGGTNYLSQLYEWNGTDAWVVKAALTHISPSVRSLAVHNDKLYGSILHNVYSYDASLVEWNGTDAWVIVAPIFGSEASIFSLFVHNGELYGGSSTSGKLLVWNEIDAWLEKADQLNTQDTIHSLVVHNGKLYGGTSPDSKLFEWNGTVVTELTQFPLTTIVAVHRNRIHALLGRVWKFTDINLINDWTTIGGAGTSTISNIKSDFTAITTYADHLVFFTSTSMQELHGTGIDNFQLIDISEDGCSAQRTLIELKGTLYWLDENEFKAYNGSYPVVISQKVHDYLDAIPAAYKYKACCGKLGKYLYLSIPYGAVTENNLLLEYDTELKQWYPQTGSFVDFVTIGDKLYGVDAAGKLWDMDNGTTDDGTAISWYKESGAYVKRSLRMRKNLQNVYVLFDQPVGSTFTLGTSATVDVSDFQVRKTFTANASEQNNRTVIDANILGYVDWFRLKLAGAGPVTVHAIEQYYKMER